ncbi:MAG: hypothetical protein JXM71_10090 [Spirochaetales bacterium]|nr:hypothetical protein [Spirochaetales bacterium]
MKHVFCDVCKKEISDPIPARTIFTMREYDLCESCHDDLEAATKSTVRSKNPFDFAWYDTMCVELVQDGVKKNRIPVSK